MLGNKAKIKNIWAKHILELPSQSSLSQFCNCFCTTSYASIYVMNLTGTEDGGLGNILNKVKLMSSEIAWCSNFSSSEQMSDLVNFSFPQFFIYTMKATSACIPLRKVQCTTETCLVQRIACLRKWLTCNWRKVHFPVVGHSVL